MIKNIILDFGGVLLNLDYQKTYEGLAQLFGVRDIQHDRFQKVLHAYERGDFSEGSFLYRLQVLSSEPIPEYELVQQWNAMLLDLPQERIDMIALLRNKYRVYLLSNTNHTHMQYVFRYLKKKYGIEDFSSLFTRAYYSHQMGVSKPDPAIYRMVLQDADISAGESLFIDDLQENVVAARRVGLHATCHDPCISIETVIQNYIEECH